MIIFMDLIREMKLYYNCDIMFSKIINFRGFVNERNNIKRIVEKFL